MQTVLFGSGVRFKHYEMFLQSGLPTLGVKTKDGDMYLISLRSLEWGEKDLILSKTQEELRVDRFNTKREAVMQGVREFKYETNGLVVQSGHLVIMAGPLFLQRVGEFNRELVNRFSGWAFIQGGFRVSTLTLSEYRELVEGLADATERERNGGNSAGSLVRRGLLALPFFRPVIKE